MQIFIEDTAGNRYECEVPTNLQIGRIAADFFEDMGWAKEDAQGRKQRTVVELVLAGKKAQRLKSDDSLEDARIEEGATLRVFPEAIAGAVDAQMRNAALIADLRQIEILTEDNEQVEFDVDRQYAPTEYIFTFKYPSFAEPPLRGQAPRVAKTHKAKISLLANYPLEAPYVQWLTPIFHPNIRPRDGAVCLGILMDRYLPGLGLARVVNMLVEMIQWRNFDIYNPLNVDAVLFAANPDNWRHIVEIGGAPLQLSWEEIINPANWGANTDFKSPLRNMRYPPEFLAAWEDFVQSKANRIRFTPIN